MGQEAQEMEVQPVSGMVIEYNLTNAAIEELSNKFKGLEIVDTKSYKVVKSAIGEVRGYRVSVEKKRKELKREALEYGRKVDGEARRITGLLTPIEEALIGKKRVVDEQKAAEKAEKARIEAERVEAIRKKIADIQKITVGLHSLNSGQLRGLIDELAAFDISAREYAEFLNHAKQAVTDAVGIVNQALGVRLQFEADELARKAEAARLEKQRAEQEAERIRIEAEAARLEEAKRADELARKAEAARLEKQRKEQEDAQKAEADRLEKQRKEQEAEAARLEEAKQAAVKKVEAEKLKIEEDREREELKKEFALKAKIKAEQDVREKEELERAAKAAEEALKPDKEKLMEFANSLLKVWDTNTLEVKTPEAKIIVDEATERLYEVARWIIERVQLMGKE